FPESPKTENSNEHSKNLHHAKYEPHLIPLFEALSVANKGKGKVIQRILVWMRHLSLLQDRNKDDDTHCHTKPFLSAIGSLLQNYAQLRANCAGSYTSLRDKHTL
ncbi:4151_t:CDS:2, partial [Gigaspora margarita]